MTFLSRLFPSRASRAELETQLAIARIELVRLHRVELQLAALQAAQLVPFMCVLVEGTGPRGPTTMGATARVSRGGVMVELTAQVPMKDVRVTVFADLEKVDVGGVFVGADYLHAVLGECPIACVPEIHLGVRIRVQASLRTAEHL
jgi:hypothetical protein